MHTDQSVPPVVAGPTPVADPLSLKDLTTLLIKHYGVHEGHFDLLIEFQIGMGSFGPTPEMLAPGAAVSISKIGLAKSVQIGDKSVDAAVVNPKPARRTSSKK